MIAREVEKQLGEILVEKGVVNREQLDRALQEQSASGKDKRRIGHYLKDMGYAGDDDICQALGIQFNLAVMRLEDIRIKPDVLDLVPENLARKFNILPLFRIGDELTLAISDPTEIQVLDILQAQTGCRVVPVIAPYGEITRFINRYYLRKIETNPAEAAKDSEGTEISRVEIEELKKAGADLPIIKTVDRFLIEAVEDGASDIHIEPRDNHLSVRFRVDGVLHEFANYPRKMSAGIISRSKILSGLDIAERQKPQDGRIQVRLAENDIDIRVSTVPTAHGEKVVMRLLNRSSVKVRMEDLGFSGANLERFRRLIQEPYGIVLVTGPTGSGKTTTLYAALHELNSLEKNIMTIEDPIEYQLPLINQVQTNEKKELTFANALRSFLRQDPDIIMVGEIRDPETAAIAAESALTGHLVLSTLHTNDAPSSVTRLTEMGVEPFLLAPSLLGIVAQRLVRTICPKCREEYTPSRAELDTLGVPSVPEGVRFSRGGGCEHCKRSGYKGRTGIHELLVVDRRIRERITRRGDVEEIRREASRNGYKDMRFDGLRKVFRGVTTVEELLRVTRNTR